MQHWTDKPNPEFEQWWATKKAEGYQCGREALENVRFGFESAQSMRAAVDENQATALQQFIY